MLFYDDININVDTHTLDFDWADHRFNTSPEAFHDWKKIYGCALALWKKYCKRVRYVWYFERCSAGITHCTFESVMEWMIGISWRESTDDQIRCLINVGDLQIPLNDKRSFWIDVVKWNLCYWMTLSCLGNSTCWSICFRYLHINMGL